MLEYLANSGKRLPVALAERAPECREDKPLERKLAEHISTVTNGLKKLTDESKSIEERVKEHDSLITELAQKYDHQEVRGGWGDESGETIGQQFARAEGLKEFADEEHRKSSFKMEMKAITSDGDSAGPLTTPARDETVMLPRQRLSIRNLLRVVRTATGIVQAPHQTERDNNAAPVAETNLKPESNYQWELKDVPVRTIAHWVEASRQILDDVPQLASMIDGELLYGLALQEDTQILYGDGTGQNLHGIVPQATAYAAPFEITDLTMIDQVGLAILQSALTNVDADGVVMHPSDWMRIRLAKNGDGEYIYGPPGVAVRPVIFGLPVVTTPSILVDKFLTGPFRVGATLYDRMRPTIMVSTEDRDNFVRNKVTVLAEERVGLAARQAASFVYGDFGNIT